MKNITRINLLTILPVVASLFMNNICFAGYNSHVAKTLNSRITAVTVYSDRALITRSASEKLPVGEHRLIFDNLPMRLEPGSIQVNGSGAAVLSDVKTNTERYAETPDRERKALMDEKTMFEDRIVELDGKIIRAQNEKGFLDNIIKKLTGVTEKTPAGELDPDKWLKMVDFYRNRNIALDKEIREAGIARRNLKAGLDKVNRQIADVGSGEQKTKYQVEVTVRMKEAGALSLRLSYIVYGPGWRPIYDLRVSTREKKMNLTYNAVIRQNTTESWDDVSLELSTAQPQIGGQQPELSPWNISFFEPRRQRMKAAEYASAPAAVNQMMLLKSDVREDRSEFEKEDNMEKPTAGVKTNATSVIFEIKGKNNIASDNLPHKVTVLIRDFPAEFRYSTVPKLSPHAYLKAKARNASDYPLLSGDTNIFLDNNFVANASLSQVAPGEDFWTFLGVDGAIKVERKFLRKYETQEGVFEKKTKMVYEYLTEITNNKKSGEEIVVWDQLPIPSHQDIVVNLLDPKFEKNTDTLKKNELNYFEWIFRMKPAEKIRIPFAFTVEYPRGRQVIGLE